MVGSNTTFSNNFTDVKNNDADHLFSNTTIYTFLALNGLSICTGLVGNIAVIIQNRYSERFQSRAQYFITALAFSGIQFSVFFGAVSILCDLVYFEWIVGNDVCSLTGFIQTASTLQTSVTLMASTIDRYFAILRPLRHQPSSAKVFGIFAVIWTISCVIPIPMAYFSADNAFNNTKLCFEVWPWTRYRHVFMEACLAITYILPLIVLLFTCIHIRTILGRKPPGEECEKMISRRFYVKKKTVRIFLTTFGTYYLCLLPKHVITTIGVHDPSIYDVQYVCMFWLTAQWLALNYPAITAVVIHMTRSSFSTCVKTVIRKTSESEISVVRDQEQLQRQRRMTTEYEMY